MSESVESAFRRGVAAMRQAAVNVCDEYESSAVASLAKLGTDASNVTAAALEQAQHTANECAIEIESMVVPFVSAETESEIDAMRNALAGYKF